MALGDINIDEIKDTRMEEEGVTSYERKIPACTMEISELADRQIELLFAPRVGTSGYGYVEDVGFTSEHSPPKIGEKMSLRWIHENLEAPTCDEECSDIDDSCSDDSYDTDLSLHENKDRTIDDEKELNGGNRRQKRETRRSPTTTVTFDENGVPLYTTKERNPPCVIWDPRQPAENPIYDSLVLRLYCRTGYHLAISPSGQVRGLSGTDESYALLRVTPVSFGVIRIQSVETRFYLAFNKKGHLYGEFNANEDNTEWEQWTIGSYDAFRSRKYSHYGWWIGIKKNGRAKPGPKTAWGHKAIQFLAVRQEQ